MTITYNRAMNTSGILHHTTILNTRYLMEYIPKRVDYQGYFPTRKQLEDRREVWNFKDGRCSERILTGLAEVIIRYAETGSVICFVPASTREKTRIRYANLATKLQVRTGIPCCLDAITGKEVGTAGHISGKKSDPAADFLFRPEFFCGKKVILIDDVYTRGNTINSTAERLIQHGALSVMGLVVARTVNPFWGWI